ncbi:hypothetical protein ASC94_14680 [Massilia sp. Root418]|uniref:hypothetical protein n=1 Tax=Massilia sp. Root418 TaxID=1736532 RepID=UPI0006FCD986|nr:hypothetical protein [Massilia sp. Root418]KQW93813.1 hypothetical protein ASC94_14680 [Massilia sp. Root418]
MSILSRAVRLTLFACAMCGAAAGSAAPVRADHPIVGVWRFVLPDGSCQEVYRMRADGTALITSAAEVAETEFVIDDKPDKNGFYKASDKIVKDNGKLDCSGQVTEVGRTVASFILFHQSGNMFLMCLQASMDACLGPFVRVRGEET